MSSKASQTFGIGAVLTGVVLFVLSVAAFITHMIYSFLAMVESGSEVVFQALATLIVGVVIPFLGVIHGFMIWFGAGLF